jgi:deoxyribodipyrimidine photolyase
LDEQIYAYAESRNALDQEGTSLLSPYIRFGMLSLRQAAEGALTRMSEAPDGPAAKSAETWLNELIWREFYISILYHFPAVLHQSFRSDLQHIKWQNTPGRPGSLAARTDRLPGGGCRHAPISPNRLDAQPGAHDHSFFPG